MKLTKVFDLDKDHEYNFFNDLTPTENLISCYMLENHFTSSLHDSNKRKEIENKIKVSNSGKTACINSLCVKLV